MSATRAFCGECHDYVEVEEIKIRNSVSGPERMLRTAVGLDCGHTIYDTRPSTQEESGKWSATKRVTFSLREKEFIDEVKGRNETANEFLYSAVRFVTSNRLRFKEFKDWRRSYHYPPTDFTEDDIPDGFHPIP